MNLEAFKAFRRVLIPSEVGSIPTHSRQMLGGLPFALALAGLAAGPARAEEEPALPGPSAFERAARSSVFPAWGQLTNGKEVKGAVLFSVQTYVWTRVIVETKKGKAADRRVNRLKSEDAGSLEIALAESSAEDHFRTRRDLLFWAIMTGFYGALDAYIDAHLGDFDEDLEEGRELFARLDPAERTLELGLRF